MPKHKIDRAATHALLDVWMDKAESDVDDTDSYMQAGAKGTEGLIYIVATPDAAISAPLLTIAMAKAGQIILRGGGGTTSELEDAAADVLPKMREREGHFRTTPRPPSAN